MAQEAGWGHLMPRQDHARISSGYKALQRITVAIRSRVDLGRVLDQLAADAGRHLDLSLCAIARWDETGGHLRFFHEYRKDPDTHSPMSLAGRSYSPGGESGTSGFEKTVIVDSLAYIVSQGAAEPVDGPLFLSYMGRGERLVVPVIAGQSLMGLVAAARPAGLPAWSEDEVEFLRAAADLAGVSIQHATMRSNLQALSSASAEINSRLEPGELLRRLTETAMRVTQSAMGVAGLREGSELVCREYCRAGSWSPIDLKFTRQRGLPGWSWTNQAPCIANDARTDPRADPVLIREYGVRTAMTVPIISRDLEVLGFFELHNKVGNALYDEDDVHLATALAHHAALAFGDRTGTAA